MTEFSCPKSFVLQNMRGKNNCMGSRDLAATCVPMWTLASKQIKRRSMISVAQERSYRSASQLRKEVYFQHPASTFSQVKSYTSVGLTFFIYSSYSTSWIFSCSVYICSIFYHLKQATNVSPIWLTLNLSTRLFVAKPPLRVFVGAIYYLTHAA